MRMFLTLQKILGILISPSLAVKFTKSKFTSVALLNLKCVYAKKMNIIVHYYSQKSRSNI